MWNKPWKLREGVLIGAGLILTGLILQAYIGPIKWDLLKWPWNLVFLGFFILCLIFIYIFQEKVYYFSYLSSYKSAVSILMFAVILTIFMGIFSQDDNGNLWNNVTSLWPFVLVYVYLDMILGVVTIKQINKIFLYIRKKLHHINYSTTNISSLVFSCLLHLGFFISLTCAAIGRADIHSLKMITSIDKPEWIAIDSEGNIKTLDLGIDLKKFILEEYEDGSPRRIASEIEIYSGFNKKLETTVEINHPVSFDNWKIYQYGYDTTMGGESHISILELVRDPWLKVVYIGIYLMLTGTVLMVFFGGKGNQGT